VIDPVLTEILADAAWPAAEQIPLGPWKLRATHGVTRRANSVFTADHRDVPAGDLEQLVADAERFYARRSLPTVFQISAGTGATRLDTLLARRGYTINGSSEVWAAQTDHFKAHSKPAADGDWTPHREDEPTTAWFDCAFDEPPDRRRVHEQIVRRVPRPRLYVSAGADNLVAGCGLAISAQGHAGLFCMATRPAYRRRGIALALVRELGAWAKSLGDRDIFLQVMSENDAAKSLYRMAGFEFAYRYHYRVK
jgi:ribosomal protein S18 acetylase RimI-like enzyme